MMNSILCICFRSAPNRSDEHRGNPNEYREHDDKRGPPPAWRRDKDREYREHGKNSSSLKMKQIYKFHWKNRLFVLQRRRIEGEKETDTEIVKESVNVSVAHLEGKFNK